MPYSPPASAGGGSGDSTSTAAYASRPSAANDGNLFLPSDGFVIERDTGAAWASWGPIFPITAPPTSGWTWDNQGSVTLDTTRGVLSFAVPADASNGYHVYHRTAPATPYTITAGILVGSTYGNGVHGAGLSFRQSSDGKIHSLRTQDQNGAALLLLLSEKWTSTTVFSANYSSTVPKPPISSLVWLQISDDGTNRITRIGSDKINWQQFTSIGRTDFLTADQVGVVIRGGATNAFTATIISWEVT